MQIKLLRDIVANISGIGTEKIVDLLYGKKNVNEFLIAKKLGMTINQTRNILYKLADEGLVSFVRKKDSKKGGWYTYFWTLNTYRALEFLKEQMDEQLRAISENLGKRGKERFYYSPAANIEYTEDEALEHDFICPETGDVMQLKDNSDLVRSLEKDADALQKVLEEVNSEMVVIEEKEMKSKERRLKAEAKIKE